MSRPILLAGFLFALAAAFPFWPALPPYWLAIAAAIGISAVVALGIVVLTGVAGILSFGQAMFVGAGAYTAALLSVRAGWPPLATLPAALAVSGALAWGIGTITLRLKGHYLPVATIAWNISLFYLAGASDLFGRYDGISGVPPLTLGPVSFADPVRFYLFTLLVLAGLLLVTRNLLRSRTGRAIRALRGGVVAAESFGIDTGRARILAFTYAGTLAGLAGWLYAYWQRAVNPSPFGLTTSIDYLLMGVVGGVGRIGGAVLGSALVTIGRDKLQDVLPALVGQGGNYEQIVFGIVLIALFHLAPEGLWPHLEGLVGRARTAAAPGHGTAPVSPGPVQAAPRPAGDVLVATGLRKSFGGLVAVDGVGVRAGAGEIVGLIGPNGAGKSTTFNLVTGVLPPSAGTVTVAGRDVTGWPARRVARLGLARTFQHVKLVRDMSVVDNVALGRHLLGRAGAIRGALALDRAEEAVLHAAARRQIVRVGLGGLEDATATDLALGQQRLVEIARALCLDPVVLLLDEPAAGLRHAEKEALARLLRQVAADGVAVLLVEHDMDFVMGLTDRLVVLNFGAELAQGRPAEIQRHPGVLEAYLGSAA